MITAAFASSAYTAVSTALTVTLSGLRNPRTTAPSSTFTVSTKDSSGYAIASQTTGITVTMTTIPNLNSFAAVQADGTNGVSNVYTFTVNSPIPHYSTDKILFTFPTEITGPSSPTCTASTNVATVVCTAPTTN